MPDPYRRGPPWMREGGPPWGSGARVFRLFFGFVFALIFLVVNLIVDIGYAVLNPRIRYA